MVWVYRRLACGQVCLGPSSFRPRCFGSRGPVTPASRKFQAAFFLGGIDANILIQLDCSTHCVWFLWAWYLHRHSRHSQLHRRQLPIILGISSGWSHLCAKHRRRSIPPFRNADVQQTRLGMGLIFVGIPCYTLHSRAVLVLLQGRDHSQEESMGKVRIFCD